MNWTDSEFKDVDLGDKRLNKRLRTIADALSQKPSESIPAAIKTPAGVKAAYRFLENPDVDGEIPPDAVDRSVLQSLLVIYREYLGPAAKIVFKQQLEGLGVTSRTLRKAQLGDLLTRLSAKIPVAQRQKEFLAAARQLRERVLL